MTKITETVTLIVGIGNSDDKLSQVEWARYARLVRSTLDEVASVVHFDGYTLSNSHRQSACWVVRVEGSVDSIRKKIEWVERNLQGVKKLFKQESIAITEGTTRLI